MDFGGVSSAGFGSGGLDRIGVGSIFLLIQFQETGGES
jgi:hypothetical protein